jgi:hypothetical protein
LRKLFPKELDVFDIYPRHGHRTPQQIAEDAGGSFEPKQAARKTGASGVGTKPRSKPSTDATVADDRTEKNTKQDRHSAR